MKKPPYFWRALLSLFVWLPLLFQGITALTLFVVLVAADALGLSGLGVLAVGAIPFGLGFLVICFRSGRGAVRKSAGRLSPEAGLRVRYLPVWIGFAYTLTVALVALAPATPTEGAVFGFAAGVIALAHITSSIVLGVGLMLGVPSIWPFLVPPLCIYAAYGFGLAAGCREQGAIRVPVRHAIAAPLIVSLALGAIVWRADFMTRDLLRGNRDAWYAERNFIDKYHPFDADNRLVKIPDPALAISENHPRLDGATAAYPVYAAAVQALYKNIPPRVSELVGHSTTPVAYERLIDGKVDVIFVAQPSPEQRAAAESAGKTLQLTPVGREAFVFFVHKDNPVDGLTSDQIRGIYAKRITNWKEVGGRDEKILPFQRPQGSGSQTAFELKVMRGERLAPPPREEFAEGMGGVIQRVAAYQNSGRAIGYSFRVFATTMNVEKNIKLLAVDGVAPTRENIRDGSYPYVADVHAVTAGSENPHVPALIAWFRSPQGQRLIDETGYVSLAEEARGR